MLTVSGKLFTIWAGSIFVNSIGTINTSDLEICGSIAHHDIVVKFIDILEPAIGMLLDNIAYVSWLSEGILKSQVH